MHQVRRLVIKRNKAVLRVNALADRVINEREQFMQIGCGTHALNDLGDDLPFIFHSPALGEIYIDCKHANWLPIGYDGNAVYLDGDDSAILASSHRFFFDDLSL